MGHRLPPPAFDEYKKQISNPPPVRQAGGSANLPVLATLPTDRWLSLGAAMRRLRDSRRAKHAVILGIVILVGIILASYALWYYAPAEAFARPLDGGVHRRDAEVTDVPPRDGSLGDASIELLDDLPSEEVVEAPKPVQRCIAPPPPSPHGVYLREGGVLSLGLLLGVIAGRRGVRRREKDAGPRSHNATPSKVYLPKRLGACSITGNTRESNQDRVRVLHVAGADVCIVADGLGGLPRGGEAAELVTSYAQEALAAELPHVLPAGADGVRALLLSIIWDAAKALAQEALIQGWSGTDVGLRTTLILAVAIPEFYVVAWIGDGGVVLLRADNTLVAVLEPHKDPATPNVLHASLGPAVEGRPSWAIAARRPGDILVAATDGIADSFDAMLAERVRKHIEACQGDAAKAAQAVVEEIAARRDEAGDFEVTDNLTLAIMLGASS